MLRTEVVTESTVLLDMANTNTGAFVVDERRRVVFWNEGAARVLGYTAEETVGLRCCDILGVGRAKPDDCAHCLGAHSWAQLLEGDVVRRVTTAVARDGVRKAVRMTTMLGHNTEGDPRVIHFIREPAPKADNSRASAAAMSRIAPGDSSSDMAMPEGAQSLHEIVTRSVVSHRRAPHSLTKREREVLKLLATGLSNFEIADTLGISPITARNHVTSVIEKLGVKTRLQAVVVAARKGLL